MLARLRKIFGLHARAPGGTLRRIVRVIRGRYDAAATTEENRRHWANADGLSANAANSPQIRRILRNRARYESANNSYAKGIVLTLANDCIGTGPRLQMLTVDAEANRQIESAFMAWAKAIALAERLRTLRMARACDGEGFLVLTNNPALPTPVKLDLRPVEAEQVSTPNLGAGGLGKLAAIDGIEFDATREPQSGEGQEWILVGPKGRFECIRRNWRRAGLQIPWKRHQATKGIVEMTEKRNTRKASGARGRKPIFTPEQKRVLDRLIRGALKEQLRNMARAV